MKQEGEARLEIAKQKMLLESGGARGETAEECARLRAEVEAAREAAEARYEEAREKREEDFKAVMKALRADMQTKLDRESTRVQRVYQQKAQEDCFSLRQRQEEACDRRAAARRDLRERLLTHWIKVYKD